MDKDTMADTPLAQRKCVPCEPGTQPMSGEEAGRWLKLVPGWEFALEGRAIRRRYPFKDFMSALAFVEKMAPIAEAEGHHPDLMLGWGYVECVCWTHSIAGLHESDFIMAAKYNAIM